MRHGQYKFGLLSGLAELFALQLGVLSVCSPVAADLFYEQVSSLRAVEQQGTAASKIRMKVYVRGRMVRAEDVDSKRVVIARLDKSVIWGINPDEKTYTELSIRDLADDVHDARRSAGVTETSKAHIAVSGSEEMEDVAGYACRKSVLSANNEPVMHTWNTLSLEIPEKAVLFDFSLALGEFPKALIDTARALPGFPMRMKAIKAIGVGKFEAFREVVAIKLDPLDPKMFELPAGLTKVDIK